MEPKEKRKLLVCYAPEVRERAVRMVREHAGEHALQWEAIVSIAEDRVHGGDTAQIGAASRTRARGAF